MKTFKVTIKKKALQQSELVKISIAKEDFSLSLLNYGGTISELITADRLGRNKNIVLNYQQATDYLAQRSFIGAAVGRVAGRISQGLWESELGTIQLEKNEHGTTHLHGGAIGFDTIFWDYQIIEKNAAVQVMFTQEIPDKLGGYPGNLKMTICYTIFADHQIAIEYYGIADKKTLINPTNHSYFNLSGDFSREISDHVLTLAAAHYLPIKQDKTPTGAILSVAGTTFDFRQGKKLQAVLTASDKQIVQEQGLNHPFLLDKTSDFDAVLLHPESGRGLKIRTTNSAIVCYSGNHFDGQPFLKHSGLALETQELPDAVNHKFFGSIILPVNQMFYQKTTYNFFAYDT